MIKLNTLLAKVDHGTSNREMATQKMLVIWALLK